MAKLYLGLGTNQGDRLTLLNQAVQLCKERLKSETLQISEVIETPAWGLTDQADFLNQCLLLETQYAPLTCLDVVLDIENEMGRKRIVKWGPRNIDIDILFYDDLVYHDSRLSVPHPYIAERAFVLRPLMEIAPDFIHPELGKSVRILLQDLLDRETSK